MRSVIAILGCVAAAALLTGCATQRSLYDRLGGEGAISAVVSDFVDHAAADPKINVTRKGEGREWLPTPENVALLKRRVTEFVCMATGGPQKYTGRDMKETHVGMNISGAEFDQAGGVLKASLDKFRVPKREQDELLAIVGTTRNDIVEKK